MEFEKAKKDFIINSKEYTKENLTKLMQAISNFAKVGEDGEVVIIKKISTRKVLKLILAARFVAHEVEDSISSDVSKNELETYSGLKKPIFIARYNEILREGFAKKDGESFKAKNILLVEKFLSELGGGLKK